MAEAAATKKQIITELSHQQVTLSAQQTTAVFYATVWNDSDRFASFQLKLIAAGITPEVTKSWYRLTPAVSSKIPAGDSTRFQIEVFDLPPIAQQFRGAIDLSVEVTSRELENQYDRQPLRLLVEGLQGQPPSIGLTVPRFQGLPGERVPITAQIHNSTGVPLAVTLRLSGIPDIWLPDGSQQTLSILPGKPQQIRFDCVLPSAIQAPSQIYPLQLEATGRFPTVVTIGEFEVLPTGVIEFACDPLEGAIPEVLGRWQNPTWGTATFALQFQNQSNVQPEIQVEVQELEAQRRWFWQRSPEPDPDANAESLALPEGVFVEELAPALPIGFSTVPLRIQRRLPWLGWTRLRQFEVTVQSPTSSIPIPHNSQTLKVHLFPVVPFWLQVLGILLALGLGTLVWMLLSDPGHRGPVNSVQFNGQGTEVLSGSDDQTILRWQVRTKRLQHQHRIGGFEKAVRVARYRPLNNDQVALGFENGEIQVVNLLTAERSQLMADKDDRVFDLVFSRNARTLYSGHGSGLVLPWDLTQPGLVQTTPRRAYDTRFAIQTMAPVGLEDQYLAIGGRYNRLVLLNLDESLQEGSQAFLNLPYPNGSSTDYVTSLSVAENQSNLLAIADTKGYLSLWDAQACLQNRGQCSSLENPWLGHSGSPVRAVALSASGCFLASAADNGQVKLWSLNEQGIRRSSVVDGRVLEQLNQPIKSVDVVETRKEVWVTRGGDDGRVRLYRVPLAKNSRQENLCPTLAGDPS